MLDRKITSSLGSSIWPWLCTCGRRLCIFSGLFPLCFITYCGCLKLRPDAFHDLVLLCVGVSGGLYVFVTCLLSDKLDKFSGRWGLCVQLAALRSSHNTTTSWGLNPLACSLSLSSHYAHWQGSALSFAWGQNDLSVFPISHITHPALQLADTMYSQCHQGVGNAHK